MLKSIWATTLFIGLLGVTSTKAATVTEVSGTFPYSRGWNLKFELYYDALDPKCRVEVGFQTLPKTRTIELTPDQLSNDRYRLKVDLKQIPDGCGWAPARLNPLIQTSSSSSWLAIEQPAPFPQTPSPIHFFCDGTGPNHGCSSSASKERWLCLRNQGCFPGPSPNPPSPVLAGSPVQINFEYVPKRIPGYEDPDMSVSSPSPHSAQSAAPVAAAGMPQLSPAEQLALDEAKRIEYVLLSIARANLYHANDHRGVFSTSVKDLVQKGYLLEYPEPTPGMSQHWILSDENTVYAPLRTSAGAVCRALNKARGLPEDYFHQKGSPVPQTFCTLNKGTAGGYLVRHQG